MSRRRADTPSEYASAGPGPIRRSLALPQAMRMELKEPLGLLLEGDPRETVGRLVELHRRLKPPMFASVGDVSSKNLLDAGVEPDIIVVDHRVMRVRVDPLSYEDRAFIHALNPPGTIDADAWRALGEAVMLKRRVAVIVEGEEDLLVLPLIVLMPIGSMIAYGQPHRGLVVVEVTDERKRWAHGFMDRMEET